MPCRLKGVNAVRGASDVIGSDWETRLMARRESIRVAQRMSCCAKAGPSFDGPEIAASRAELSKQISRAG